MAECVSIALIYCYLFKTPSWEQSKYLLVFKSAKDYKSSVRSEEVQLQYQFQCLRHSFSATGRFDIAINTISTIVGLEPQKDLLGSPIYSGLRIAFDSSDQSSRTIHNC